MFVCFPHMQNSDQSSTFWTLTHLSVRPRPHSPRRRYNAQLTNMAYNFEWSGERRCTWRLGLFSAHSGFSVSARWMAIGHSVESRLKLCLKLRPEKWCVELASQETSWYEKLLVDFTALYRSLFLVAAVIKQREKVTSLSLSNIGCNCFNELDALHFSTPSHSVSPIYSMQYSKEVECWLPAPLKSENFRRV